MQPKLVMFSHRWLHVLLAAAMQFLVFVSQQIDARHEAAAR